MRTYLVQPSSGGEGIAVEAESMEKALERFELAGQSVDSIVDITVGEPLATYDVLFHDGTGAQLEAASVYDAVALAQHRGYRVLQAWPSNTTGGLSEVYDTLCVDPTKAAATPVEREPYFGPGFVDHADFPRSAWKAAVAGDQTVYGYDEWVELARKGWV